ncbi:MAG TPA: hypothetical protein VLB44_16500 [Kofleriaceae bacterium]|nr:hypothetical protein [Kofleriaceae bacterium]
MFASDRARRVPRRALRHGGMASNLLRPVRMFEDSVETVSIEDVRVGDFVFPDPTTVRPTAAKCVVRKRTMSNARTERVVGWVVELSDDAMSWWPRGTRILRRRT